MILISTKAQTVRYATRVVEVSSESGSKQYAAQRILGRPDAMPQGGESPSSWMPKSAKSSSDHIQVAFETPMKIMQVAVFENLNPGSIKFIYLVDAKGNLHKVYTGTPGSITEEIRVLRKTFSLTKYEVTGVRIEIAPSKVNGNVQIDAIAISDSDAPIEAKINMAPDSEFGSRPENLGANINSEYSEVLPVISPDGKTLFFVRDDHPDNTGRHENIDIWYATLNTNGEWSVAENIGPPLNNKAHNFVNSVTPDGNMLLLGNQYFKSGLTENGASVSFKEKDGWSFPVNLDIVNYYSHNEFTEFNLSNDGKAILMTLERDEGQGGRDIYVSFRLDEYKWSEPMNLGSQVNTPGDETSPFLAADGTTLYFATNGKSTYGKHDVFFSKRIDSTWQNWTEPLNLGPDINTAGADAYYTIPAAGDYAYFVSTANSYGRSDIFRIKLPEAVQPDPVVLIYGNVYNKRTMEPLGAKILYEILPGGREAGIARSQTESGEYKIVLPYGKNYGFRALAEGFISENDNLDLTEVAEYKEIKKDLYLAPIEIGEIVRLNNIFFDYDKATLRSESYPELDRVVDFLSTNSKVEIELSGHTDSKGSDDYNMTLSQNRANAVVDYLIERGVNKDRLISKGYGKTKPVATNETDEGRQFNRRVEFEILKK